MAEGTGTGTGTGTGEVGDATVGEVQGLLADYLPASTAEEGKGEEKAAEEKEGGEEKPVGEESGEHKEGEPSVPAAAKEAEPSADVKALVEQVKALQAKIDEMSKPKEAEKPREEAKPLLTKYFNKQEEFEAAFEKPEAMEAVLNKVRVDAVEDVMKNIPQVVTNLVKTHITVTKAVDNFYSKNPELENKRDFVSHVANELMGKNPGWSLSKLFNEELGKEVNRRLGVKPGTSQTSKTIGQPPPPRGQRKPAEKTPSMEPLQKEITDLIM